MRRNLLFLENIMSESTNSSLYKTTLPAGDYHAHSEGGKLCVADDRWRVLAFIRTPNTEAEFHLDKQMTLNIQAQDKTTCRNVAIESKPAYDIFVFGGGASKLLHRADRAILTSRLVVGRENRESMAGPALREQGRHLEFDTGSCHHSEGRRPLGIHPSRGLILHPESEVRMHDDAAQPAQLMGLHAAGVGGYVAHGKWGVRLGHHQRRSKECCWPPCGCRYQDHGDGHVRRRSGRMADTAGGGSARLRSRHRALLNPSLGVAA